MQDQQSLQSQNEKKKGQFLCRVMIAVFGSASLHIRQW